MISKAEIASLVRMTVKEVTGRENLNDGISLLDIEMNIPPTDILYIFDILESRLELPVHLIFMNKNYDVFTIDNLSNALFELACDSDK